MNNAEMTKSPLWDSVIHADHAHWCDLELNSFVTCVAKAHQEHALQWGGDVLSFGAVIVLLLLMLRPLARALATWDGDAVTIHLPLRRFTRCAPATVQR